MINPSMGVIRRAGSLKMIKKARDSILLFSTVDSLAFMMASSNLNSSRAASSGEFKFKIWFFSQF
jgi:hypothetical protein